MLFSFLAWAAMSLSMITGINAFWHHTVKTAEKACHCTCGMVYAEERDFPEQIPGEQWGRPSDWFGAHVTVCFPHESSDYARQAVRTLQMEADINRSDRLIREHRAAERP